MIRSLRDKKSRDELGLFIVEGEKMVREAISSSFEVEGVWRRDEIGEKAMERISLLSSPSPVLAVVRKKAAESGPVEKRLYLALDGVRDPGNMGTILRLADWFGVDCVYASPESVDIYNPKVVQSTMGAIFRINVAYTDIPSVCRRFSAAGMPVYGTFLDGNDIYSETLSTDGLVIMGNESEGISPQVAAEVTSRLFIPSFATGPTAESLNVAIASAVTLSEFKRRSR